MTPLEELNKRFQYTPDNGEYWKIMKNKNGPLKGDCEDYSLTLIWMLEGKSMFKFWWALITFKYVIWYCTTPRGEGHAIMYHRGKWIDNITKEWKTTKTVSLKFPMIFPFVALKMLLRSILKRV